MNKCQQGVLYVASALLIISFLFPPWIEGMTMSFEGRTIGYPIFHGYHFLLDPPKADLPWAMSIYISFLVIQMVMIILLAAIFFLIVSRKDSICLHTEAGDVRNGGL